MDVKIESKCGRCGKKHEQTMSLERAAGMSAEEQKKAQALSLIQEFASALNPDLHPELVMIHKNEGGAYEVHTLDNLCSNTDAKRNKGCSARVMSLVSEIFAAPKEKKPRAPRKAKEPKDNGATKAKK